MPILIYLVYGESGEYESRTVWNVCAFTSEREAQGRVDAAQAAARAIELRRREIWSERENELTVFKELEAATENPHDTHMIWSDTTPRYSIEILELHVLEEASP